MAITPSSSSQHTEKHIYYFSRSEQNVVEFDRSFISDGYATFLSKYAQMPQPDEVSHDPIYSKIPEDFLPYLRVSFEQEDNPDMPIGLDRARRRVKAKRNINNEPTTEELKKNGIIKPLPLKKSTTVIFDRCSSERLSQPELGRSRDDIWRDVGQVKIPGNRERLKNVTRRLFSTPEVQKEDSEPPASPRQPIPTVLSNSAIS